MRALLILAAVASTAYVGYSYNATDGESCLVCPMTGEPIFTSAQPKSATGSCCSGSADAMLTGIAGEGASCCSKAKAPCCSEGAAEAMLTSTDSAECHGDCEKGCCKDKTNAVDVAAGQEEVTTDAAEGTAAVVAEATETE